MKRLRLGLILGLGAFCAQAQEAPFRLGGALESYYQHSPQGHVPTSGSGAPVLEGRIFDNLNEQFVANLIELSLSKQFAEVLIRIDLGFGQQVDAMATNGTIDPATGQPFRAESEASRNVTQAFVIYKPTEFKDLSICFGKFYAFIGFEGFRARDNWQYSRSFNYNFNPYWHEGVNLKYSIWPERLTFALYYLNASDGRLSQEANRSPSIGASLNASLSDNWTVSYNYLGGKESNLPGSRRDVHELNSMFRLNSSWSFAADYAFARQSKVLASGDDGFWWVVDGYIKFQPFAWYYFSPRYEFVEDSNQGVGLSAFSPSGGIKQRIHGLTLTNSFRLKPEFEVRAEWRRDQTNADGYFKADNGSSTRVQESYTLAALLGF